MDEGGFLGLFLCRHYDSSLVKSVTAAIICLLILRV